MKIAIISPGTLPIPSVKGGAVETLIDEMSSLENYNLDIQVYIFSIWEKDLNSKNCIYIKPSLISKFIDRFFFFILDKILRRKNAISFRFLFERMSYVSKVALFLKKNDFDKIIIENSTPLFLILKKHKNYIKYKNNYYYHLHNETNNDFRCEDIIQNCNRVFCVSNFIKEKFLERYKVSKDRVVVVKNPVPNLIYSEYNPFVEFGGKKILLYVGRITKEKGILHLIKALKTIDRDDFRLFIVGSSFFKSKSKTLFQKDLINEAIDIKDKIVFTGYIDHKKIGDYYKKAYISILPSVWQEPAGLTMIESIYSGTPIITTTNGGIPEYLIDGTNITIEFNDDQSFVGDLRKSIIEILDNEEKVKLMKNNCKNIDKRRLEKQLFLDCLYHYLIQED